jgi:O-antigen/teichoic acid export membrane protein
MAQAAVVVSAPDPQISPPVKPRRLVINLLYLTVGELAAKLLTFASFSYMARVLGPWYYGLLEFTLALMVFFTLPVDLGLGAYGAREIARNPGDAPRLLHEITGIRVLLALCSMLALGVVIVAIHPGTALKRLLILYGLSLLGWPFLLQWFFQAYDRMHWVAIASIVRQGVFAVLVFLFCRYRTDVLWIGMAECVSVAAVGVFCVYTARYRMQSSWAWPELHFGRLWKHLKQASPIGFTELAWAFMWYFCTVLLGFIFSDDSLGWFSASHRALMALHTFVWLYFFNLLPSITRCASLPNEHLLELMDRSVRFAAWVGLFAAAFLTAASPLVLTLVFGPAYREAWLSFSVLVWMLPVAMLSGHHRYILIAYNHTKPLLYSTAASAVVAGGLSFVLVPLYNGPGAACALLAANLINFTLVYFCVKRLVVRVPVSRQLGAPLLALAVAAFFYLALAHWNFWVALAAASVTYTLILAWSDGRELMSFAQAILRRPAANGETA